MRVEIDLMELSNQIGVTKTTPSEEGELKGVGET